MRADEMGLSSVRTRHSGTLPRFPRLQRKTGKITPPEWDTFCDCAQKFVAKTVQYRARFNMLLDMSTRNSIAGDAPQRGILYTPKTARRGFA
jgi:hypothetical protein